MDGWALAAELGRWTATAFGGPDGAPGVDCGSVLHFLDRSAAVDTVTISPKFQVVIPRALRERLGLKPGQKVQAIAYENRIELIPVRPLRSMRGFLAGIDTRVARERDRP